MASPAQVCQLTDKMTWRWRVGGYSGGETHLSAGRGRLASMLVVGPILVPYTEELLGKLPHGRLLVASGGWSSDLQMRMRRTTRGGAADNEGARTSTRVEVLSRPSALLTGESMRYRCRKSRELAQDGAAKARRTSGLARSWTRKLAELGCRGGAGDGAGVEEMSEGSDARDKNGDVEVGGESNLSLWRWPRSAPGVESRWYV